LRDDGRACLLAGPGFSRRGLVLTSADANGVVTTSQYDSIGRLNGVWLDSRPTSDNPNYYYFYYVNQTGPSGIEAGRMGEGGGYARTFTIVDSLGRTRQTQTDTPQGGRLITDTVYDSRGWVSKTSNRYWDSSATPTLSLAGVADNQVPDQDRYTYNGLGEVVQDNSYSYAVLKATTTTVYNGDRTTIIPPAGGVTTATVTDPLGRTSQVQEYTSAPTLNTPSNTFTGIWYLTGGTATSTSYGYDGHGNLSTITDANGNKWTSQYDLLGRVTTRTTPDTGTTTMQYDGNGNLLQAVDARGATDGVVSWTYDALNRKTGEYAAPVTGQIPGPAGNQIAAWTYDNSGNTVPGMTYPIGHLTTETSYSGGDTYTIQAAGFNIFGESLGQTYTIPGSAGTGLAGTWTFTHTYTSNNGLPLDDSYPSGGGLPAETTQHTYLASPLDLPAGLGGSLAGYAGNPVYDAYGDVTQEEIGENNNGTPDFAYITSTPDPWSLRLTDSELTRTITPTVVDDESYTYDTYGNITQQVSSRMGNTSAAESQCFKYDPLDRLTSAWTATDGCATTPTSSNESMVGDPLSAASAYWTSWNYDNLDRLTSQVNHDSAAGGTDTTITDTYDGNSTGQVHTLTSSAETGGSTASSTFTWDAAGYMKTRATPATGTQTLTWDNAGQLTQIASTAKGTTKYVYDADGNLLLQEDPGSTTLYLDGEQLTRDTTTGTVTGARIIPLPEGGDAVRTGDGSSYYFEIPNLQGTSTLYLDSTAQIPAWRQFTPYGAPRGQAVTWIDNRGFLNKPHDPGTGLTDLGARQYDPATTQFTAPDPILTPANPQDLNPYAYAQDNPITNTDPTGLLLVGTGSGCGYITSCTGGGSGGDSGGGSGSGGTPPPSGSGTSGGDLTCGYRGSCTDWGAIRGPSLSIGTPSDLGWGALNGLWDSILSGPHMVGSLLTGMINGMPTGVTANGQAIYVNGVTNPVTLSPFHHGNPNSILYQTGYIGAPLMVAAGASSASALSAAAEDGAGAGDRCAAHAEHREKYPVSLGRGPSGNLEPDH
jgi:RHS repeat-associated protein